MIANRESGWPITSSSHFVQLVILREAKNLGFFVLRAHQTDNQRCLKAWPDASHLIAARRST